ncbi:squalene/phytoene synthase family protein [Sphingomonas flavalba]|uniref:squalene/phytoene synthase family protein n=1 Tax=Sphingomonas flavalba TaxID=2559804 RepID=UPI0039DF7C39
MDPERRLAVAYAPEGARGALLTLWRLDATLADVVRTTTEPTIGRMRLTWWYDALLALDDGPPAAEPLLALFADILPERGVPPARLTPLIDGWEALLDPLPLKPDALDDYARGRGGGQFRAAAALIGVDPPDGIDAAGQLWALVDLAFHISDPVTAERAITAARVVSTQVPRRWPSALRALGLLTVLARRDAGAGLAHRPRPGAPRRVIRGLWHAISGR